jgi:hypothetical protein
MKAYTMLAAGLFLASIPALGQSRGDKMQHDSPHSTPAWSYNEDYIQKAIKNYAVAVNSLNDGVAESALAHLTFLRIDLPQLDLKKIEATMINLAETGRTPVIRYKAYLASIVFESPASFVKALNTEATNSDQFFSAVASQVQKTLLGQNLN